MREAFVLFYFLMFASVSRAESGSSFNIDSVEAPLTTYSMDISVSDDFSHNPEMDQFDSSDKYGRYFFPSYLDLKSGEAMDWRGGLLSANDILLWYRGRYGYDRIRAAGNMAALARGLEKEASVPVFETLLRQKYRYLSVRYFRIKADRGASDKDGSACFMVKWKREKTGNWLDDAGFYDLSFCGDLTLAGSHLSLEVHSWRSNDIEVFEDWVDHEKASEVLSLAMPVLQVIYSNPKNVFPIGHFLEKGLIQTH